LTFVVCYTLNEIMFYFAHRLLHSKVSLSWTMPCVHMCPCYAGHVAIWLVIH
jgi:hypothetical protein